MLYKRDIDKISNTALLKWHLLKTAPLKYFLYSIMASSFIIITIVLSNVVAAVLYPTFPQFGKLISSLFFPTAIILIVFLGGELFTSNNMVMAVGFFDKKVTGLQMCSVWFVSYVGNFMGAFIFSTLYVISGASSQVLTEYLNIIMADKLQVDILELIVRGILCNFLVCLAVFTNFRLKSESGKFAIMFMLITTFVIAGFEHSIANMGTFIISYYLLGGISIPLIIKNLVFVSIGNIIGGAFMLGLPIKLMEIKEE